MEKTMQNQNNLEKAYLFERNRKNRYFQALCTVIEPMENDFFFFGKGKIRETVIILIFRNLPSPTVSHT